MAVVSFVVYSLEEFLSKNVSSCFWNRPSEACCRCLSEEIHRLMNSKECFLFENLPHISFIECSLVLKLENALNNCSVSVFMSFIYKALSYFSYCIRVEECKSTNSSDKSVSWIWRCLLVLVLSELHTMTQCGKLLGSGAQCTVL